MRKLKLNSKGLTLIELLIVVAIIAILATAVFVALDPLKRLQDSRDSKRWSDASELLNALKVSQVDNGGKYITAVDSAVDGQTYMIVGDSTTAGCDDQNDNCDVDVTSDNSCINLAELAARGYLGKIPVSPNGDGLWSTSITGYVLTASSSGSIKIDACESENTSYISVTR